MAWDWNQAGRVDEFQFEKVSCKNIDTTLGNLECLVTGGTLSFSYYSDLKVSGTLNVINAPSSMQEDEYLIRIWYCPTLLGESKRIELGTFYFTANLHYENGMYKGTLELRSTLARHIDDVTVQKWSLSKNKLISTCYKDVFKSLGGYPKIEGVKDSKLSKTTVYDVGTSPMTILQKIADSANAEIGVTPHGHTVLRPYKKPADKKKSISHTIVANKRSVILPGLDISNSIKEIPNRVVCVFDHQQGKNVTQYVGKAALASSEPRSYQNTGRWVTKYYKLTNCGKPFNDYLTKKAKSLLSQANSKIIYYEFDTYYQPIEIGEVIELRYDNISIKGLVSNIDLSLEVGAKMHVKIRKV